MSASPDLAAVVYRQVIESLLSRPLQEGLTPEARHCLGEVGIDPSQPLQAAYPLETWTRLLEACASTRYAALPYDEAVYRIGQDFALGLSRTILGRTLMGMARLIGPRRMLGRMTANYRWANNYLEGSLAELADDALELTTRVRPELAPALRGGRLPSPHYMRGLLATALRECCSPHAEVELLEENRERLVTRYRIRLG